MEYPEVQCPLFIRRFKRHSKVSILCDGEPETHMLMSKSIKEREEKIEKRCNDFEQCKNYQDYKQINKKSVK